MLKRVFQLTLKPDLGNSSVGRLIDISFEAKRFLYPFLLTALLIFFWQFAVDKGILPSFFISSPSDIVIALIGSSNVILNATLQTLYESIVGLQFGILSGYFLAIIMDRFVVAKLSFYPIISATQAIPIIAIAPVVILLFGFGAAPKIFLVSLMTFFPIAISCYGAFSSIPKENIEMSKSVGAGYLKTLIHVKVPQSATSFFDSLKISVTYAFGGAVIAEWLGGDIGLGTCMSRFRKSFLYDEMFACVVVVIVVTLLMVQIVRIIERRVCKWK